MIIYIFVYGSLIYTLVALGLIRDLGNSRTETTLSLVVRPCLKMPRAGDELGGRLVGWHVQVPGFHPSTVHPGYSLGKAEAPALL